MTVPSKALPYDGHDQALSLFLALSVSLSVSLSLLLSLFLSLTLSLFFSLSLWCQADREWDAWKEENARGSGNKMGKRF